MAYQYSKKELKKKKTLLPLTNRKKETNRNQIENQQQ